MSTEEFAREKRYPNRRKRCEHDLNNEYALEKASNVDSPNF